MCFLHLQAALMMQDTADCLFQVFARMKAKVFLLRVFTYLHHYDPVMPVYLFVLTFAFFNHPTFYILAR